MEIEVTQVSFLDGATLVAGEPVGDATKVVLASADAAGAFPLAIAVAAGRRPVVDVPEDAIIDILEKPQG
jgi:hypothetical protein